MGNVRKSYSVLIENIFSLLTLRALEYILAFILVPYLIRVLGPLHFGMIAFMQGIMEYFRIFVDFGYSLTAPKAIAQAEEQNISSLFAKYFYGKVCILIFITAVFFAIYNLQRILLGNTIDILLFQVMYCGIIGNVLFPVWFFQGIQKMRYITILNMSGRICTMLGIFLLVKFPDDYILAAFLQSCTPLIAGIFSIVWLRKHYTGLFKLPPMGEIINSYKEGWSIFVSSLAVNLYTATNVVVLGMLTNNVIVGYYSAADKLITCVRRGIYAVSDAIYPFISKMMRDDIPKGLQFIKKQLFLYLIVGLVGCTSLFFFSDTIVRLLFGADYDLTVDVLRILSFVPLAVAISSVFGEETMLPLNMNSAYSRTLVLGAFFSLISIFPLCYLWGAKGVAITMLLTEFLIMSIMGGLLRKQLF